MRTKTKLKILPQTKFINCRKSTPLSGIAKLAVERRRFNDAISFDVESVEIVEKEWTGRKYERLLKVWIYSCYAECNSFLFTESLGEVA